MEFLLLLAAKSLIIAGGTLLLLKLMQRRSSSDRSWVAHLGLLALLLLPVGSMALPAMEVVGPAALSSEPSTLPRSITPTAVANSEGLVAPLPSAATMSKPTPVDWGFWAYAAPTAFLLLLTLIALGRLTLLKVRAEVLVDAHWLQALARAQQRMGFKSGTALLTSDELRSPISWGLMRPVILLNTDAKEAREEAEAIIAHELAHVARLDWAKLMLSRVTVALFWFNPLVWLLAREAHQLREEAADDAVLAANIEDTEYANLLVGIARHECRGLLLGAHGVAPGKGSLTRRVKRVLDAALERAPGGWKWSSAAAFFAAGMTVPVAALQFVSPTIAEAKEQGRFGNDQIAEAASVAAPAQPAELPQAARESETVIPSGTESVVFDNGRSAVRISDDGTIASVGPAVQTALARANGAVAMAQSSIDRAAALKALGASPEYVRSLRNAAPHLRLTHEEIVQMAALGVSAEYLRDLANTGQRRLNAEEIISARALGINGAYVRGMASAGYSNLSLDDLSELRAMGITPSDVARYRRANRGLPSVDALIEAKASGLTPEDIDPHDSE